MIAVSIVWLLKNSINNNSILYYRCHIGPKVVSEERRAEALRLQGLLEVNTTFSFIRIGDFEFALLEDGQDPQGEEEAWKISGTEPRGSTGLDARHRADLTVAIRQADFVDFSDLLWSESFEPLLRYRAMAKTTCSTHRAGYILGTWVENHFKSYCQGRRVLFCGAEAPILQNLCKDPEYLEVVKEFFEPGEGAFFLRPREDGRNLANNLQGIREDIIAFVRENRIDTIFLSLGAGAKILCVQIARELGIHAIDFGAFMRALCYSGSDGNRGARSTHSIFLFRVPFLTYMKSLEIAFPTLEPEEILAKAHAQLILEVQHKEVGWTHSGWELEFSDKNIDAFKRAFKIYKRKYRHLFRFSSITKRERINFLHFCGKHHLTLEGRLFFIYFNIKSWVNSSITKLLRHKNSIGNI